MKHVSIPAGSTPGEKERGRWMKLTEAEILCVYHYLSMSFHPNARSAVKKLEDQMAHFAPEKIRAS